MNRKEFVWMFAAVLFVVAFVTFRSFTVNESSPYASEIAAAFVGTLLTVIVTALLLKQQTVGEEHKEKNIKIYEAKLKAYESLMETIETIVLDSAPGDNERTERHKIRMALQCEKTRFIANDAVEAELRALVRAYFEVIEDGDQFSYEDDWKPISRHVASVAGAMKLDLETHLAGQAGPKPKTDGSAPEAAGNLSTSAPTKDATIMANPAVNGATSFEPRETNKTKFLSQCDADERPYFESIIDYCETNSNRVLLVWGTKGFSIKDIQKRPLLWMFPTRKPKWNIQFVPKGFSDSEKSQINALLSSDLSKLISYRPSELPLTKVTQIIHLLTDTRGPSQA